MKKVVLMLAVGGLMLATPSCKKGENDPGLSLSSRKARISGEWNVASYDASYKEVNGSDSESGTEKFDGSKVTSTWTQTVSGVTTNGTSTEVITVSLADFIINKDGTYSSNWDQVSVDTDVSGGLTTVETTTSTRTESGSWSFIGKAKDEYKNKERVVLNTTSWTTTNQTTTVFSMSGVSTTDVGSTYTNVGTATIGENASIYDIDMLKGKEMTWKMVSGGNYTFTAAGGTGSSSSSTSSEEGSMTIQLTAK